VPVGMPRDTPFHSYFPGAGLLAARLRAAGNLFLGASLAPAPVANADRSRARYSLEFADMQRFASTSVPAADDDLVALAGMLEPDGGMPGGSSAVRAGRTIAAVFAFVRAGNTLAAGIFRMHLKRLTRYLQTISPTSDAARKALALALSAASTGGGPEGDWPVLAMASGTEWEKIEAALRNSR